MCNGAVLKTEDVSFFGLMLDDTEEHYYFLNFVYTFNHGILLNRDFKVFRSQNFSTKTEAYQCLADDVLVLS